MAARKQERITLCLDKLAIERGHKGTVEDFLRRHSNDLTRWSTNSDELLKNVLDIPGLAGKVSLRSRDVTEATPRKQQNDFPEPDNERQQCAKAVAHWVCRLKNMEEEVIYAQLAKPDVSTEVLRTLATAVAKVVIDLTVRTSSLFGSTLTFDCSRTTGTMREALQ